MQPVSSRLVAGSHLGTVPALQPSSRAVAAGVAAAGVTAGGVPDSGGTEPQGSEADGKAACAGTTLGSLCRPLPLPIGFVEPSSPQLVRQPP